MARRLALFLPAALAILGLAGATRLPTGEEADWLDANRDVLLAQFARVDEDRQLDDRGVAGPVAEMAGQRLFFDPRLSGSGALSCASCHQPDRQWTDGRQVAQGIEVLQVNTPTLLGVAKLKWLFWDGRAIGLSHQTMHPMMSPAEMGGSADKVLRIVASEEVYRRSYEQIFGPLPQAPCLAEPQEDCRQALQDGLFNVARLIAAFVATIPQPRTRFDDMLVELESGRRVSAFDTSEIRGLKLFVEKGNCVSCHSGRDLTDGQFHNVLVPEAAGPGAFTAGRYEGLRTARSSMANTYSGDGAFSLYARKEIERARSDSSTYAAFKTPTLRSLICTAPFMHNGRFSTLERVVDHYSLFEDVLRPEHHDDPLLSPRNFTSHEKEDLIAFLRTASPVDGCTATVGISLQ